MEAVSRAFFVAGDRYRMPYAEGMLVTLHHHQQGTPAVRLEPGSHIWYLFFYGIHIARIFDGSRAVRYPALNTTV